MKFSANKVNFDRYQALGIGPRWIRRSLLLTTPKADLLIQNHAEESTLTTSPTETGLPSSLSPISLDKKVNNDNWDELEKAVVNCQQCHLAQKRTQPVFGVGDKKANLMIIGEAPGAEEDKQGKPFVGLAGKLLDNMLTSIQLSREHNVFIANVLKCRPPENRNPEPNEVAACSSYLERQIALVNPKVILAVGRYAINSLLNTEAPISALRGKLHQYQGIPVIVTYHPAYLLRNLPDKFKAWQDLLLAKMTLTQYEKASA